jgi:hypothetical protein
MPSLRDYPIALAAVEVVLLQTLAALIATGPRWRRGLAAFVALPNVFLAWQIPPEHTLARAMIELGGSFGYLRLLDLVLERTAFSPLRRVWHAIALIDTTRLTYGAPALDFAALVRTIGYGTLTGASAWVCFALEPTLAGPLEWGARFGGGLVFAYTLTDTVYSLVALLFRAGGVTVYELHRAPVLARSVQEFWGERWARTVSLLLFARTFRPLARRRMPRLGFLAAFGASGLLHAVVLLPALGWEAAGLWGLYFLVQGGVVVIERAIHVARWSTPLAHAWVALVMLGTSPLFVGPLLRVVTGG